MDDPDRVGSKNEIRKEERDILLAAWSISLPLLSASDGYYRTYHFLLRSLGTNAASSERVRKQPKYHSKRCTHERSNNGCSQRAMQAFYEMVENILSCKEQDERLAEAEVRVALND
ncbi:hypothetical protein QTP88_023624 [Uroleucon formosanum]